MALVRLKPYNPRKGHVMRRFVSLKYNLRFKGDRGWYEVSDSVAEKLREICQNSNTEAENDALALSIPLLFDIARDSHEAARIEDSYRAREGRESRKEIGTADNPLRAGGSPRPGKKPGAGPKTRQRRTANQKVEEQTADQLSDARQAEIETLAEESKTDLRKRAKSLDLKVRRGATPEEIATLIVDKKAEIEAFGDE